MISGVRRAGLTDNVFVHTEISRLYDLGFNCLQRDTTLRSPRESDSPRLFINENNHPR